MSIPHHHHHHLLIDFASLYIWPHCLVPSPARTTEENCLRMRSPATRCLPVCCLRQRAHQRRSMLQLALHPIEDSTSKRTQAATTILGTTNNCWLQRNCSTLLSGALSLPIFSVPLTADLEDILNGHWIGVGFKEIGSTAGTLLPQAASTSPRVSSLAGHWKELNRKLAEGLLLLSVWQRRKRVVLWCSLLPSPSPCAAWPDAELSGAWHKWPLSSEAFEKSVCGTSHIHSHAHTLTPKACMPKFSAVKPRQMLMSI